MPTIGYLPFAESECSAEAAWLREHLNADVAVATAPSLNVAAGQRLPALDRVRDAAAAVADCPDLIVEGPGGFLWVAVLRAQGVTLRATILPYLNPRCWYDVAAVALYRRFASPTDRAFLGSAPSAGIYRALGVQAKVAEPYGIDEALFQIRADAPRVRDLLGIPPGRVLLFSGRLEADKDVYTFLRLGLKAQVLFPDLQLVIASHVVDPAYFARAREALRGSHGVHFVFNPEPEHLADLYNIADVFCTASTSHFETFGRAPAEALACGTPAIAPAYDGFAEVLDQPGGYLVELDTAGPTVREDSLLRGVYDALTSPARSDRAEIASIARRRFGRSTTIRRLSYLVDGAATAPAMTATPRHVELPAKWRHSLNEIAVRDRRDVVSWFWNACDHEDLAAYDAQFADRVRRSLCQPAGHQNVAAVAACR